MKITTSILSRMRKGTVAALMPMLATASCNQSPDERATEIDEHISKTKNELIQLQDRHEQMAQEMAARDTAFVRIARQLESDRQRIDSLEARNAFILDSVFTRQAQKAAREYPLNQFMTAPQIKELGRQLGRNIAPWARDAARNIIAGRGTLLDLYAVSFELDYVNYDAPFYILNDRGAVRFNNPILDVRADNFDAIMESIEADILQGRTIHNHCGAEYRANKREIATYDSLCIVHDSIYENIERQISEKTSPRKQFLAKNLMRLQNRRTQLTK